MWNKFKLITSDRYEREVKGEFDKQTQLINLKLQVVEGILIQ